MRGPLAAVVLACAALALPAQAQTSPDWTYAYTNGVATATQTTDGHVVATFTCAPPTGDILVTDYSFRSRDLRRVTNASVRIGNLAVTIPATSERQGRNQVLVVHLPQRPPMLAGAQPTDVVSVTVNNVTHSYAAGSATKMTEVAYACWGS